MREQRSAKRYYVSGTVQGVGYRHFTKTAATKLDVSGYARNLRDGRVEVYAIGSAGSLEALRAELRRGPHSSHVEDLTEEEAKVEPPFANQFSIEYDN